MYDLQKLPPAKVKELYRNALQASPHAGEPAMVAYDGPSMRGSERYLIAFVNHPDEILYVRYDDGHLRGEVNEHNFAIRIISADVTRVTPKQSFWKRIWSYL